MPQPAHRVSEESLGFLAPERDGPLEKAALGVALENPERIPYLSCTRPTDVRVAVPPARPGIANHIPERVVDLETTDKAKFGATVDRLEAREKNDQIAGLRSTKAERAPGAAAVVAVRSRFAS